MMQSVMLRVFYVVVSFILAASYLLSALVGCCDVCCVCFKYVLSLSYFVNVNECILVLVQKLHPLELRPLFFNARPPPCSGAT
jgi:hypothetical protein